MAALDMVDGLSYYKITSKNLVNNNKLYQKLQENIKKHYTMLSSILDKIQPNQTKDLNDIIKNNFSISAQEFLKGIVDATHIQSVISNSIVSEKNTLENILICHDCIIKMYKIITNEVIVIGSGSVE